MAKKTNGEPSASDLIKEALNEKVDKPSEIVEWVKAKYGKEVSKSNVNQVKVAWKKAKAGSTGGSQGTTIKAMEVEGIKSRLADAQNIILETSVEKLTSQLDYFDELQTPIEVDLRMVKLLLKKHGKEKLMTYVKLFE